MKLSNLQGMMERDRLSEYLPWVAYDQDAELYYNADNTMGFILELDPIPFAGDSTIGALQTVYSMMWPQDTLVQIIMYADPNQAPLLEAYQQMRQDYYERNINNLQPCDTFLQSWSQKYCQYLMDHRFKGISPEIPVPFRNFRVFMTAKAPCTLERYGEMSKKMTSLRDSVVGTLRTGNLNAMKLPPQALISWMHRVFNPGHQYMKRGMYDQNQEIREQVIEADTVIERQPRGLSVDDCNVRVYTPKVYANNPNPYSTNLLLGDIMRSNLNQIPCPFMLTLNLEMKDVRKQIEKKANLVLAQKSLQAVAPKLARKQKEFQDALHHFEEGARYINGYYTLSFFEKDEERVENAASTIEGLWDQQGFKLQRDIFLTLPLFMAQQPFGLYNEAIEGLGRMRPASAETFAIMSPVQGDWQGTPTPVMLFLSRRGQVMHLDFRDSLTNYNVLLCAQSGAGKSFLTNYMVTNYLSIGGQVFVIDVGRSYKKLCELLGGQYVEFTRDAGISLNVFSQLNGEMLQEDLDEEKASTLNMYTRLLAQMGKPYQQVDDYEFSLLSDVILEAYRRQEPGTTMQVDNFIEILKEKDRQLRDEELQDRRAADWAQMLEKYSSRSMSGQWFQGELNLNFNNNFVVLELEELNQLPELREVVLLLIISVIDRTLYFSDRDVPKLIVIDEAWDLLRGGNTGQFIETGYRRARKYGGSFMTITQSILDFYKENNSQIGQAIVSNSAYKLLMQQKQEDIEIATKENKLVLNEFEKYLLRTVHSSPGNYSEIFIKTDEFFGVARLFVDKFSEYLYNTNPRIVHYIESRIQEGKSLTDAIEQAISEGVG